MNITSSIALSGMNAAQTLLQTSANNIANQNTTNYTRQDVAQSSLPQGGASAKVVTSGGASLETDMVQQLQAKNSYLANLSTFKTSNEMLGTLLNISA